MNCLSYFNQPRLDKKNIPKSVCKNRN